MKAIRRVTVRTALPVPIASLEQLARNLRWSWHAPTRDLFAGIDHDLWKHVQGDPVALLGELTPGKLEELAADPQFVTRVREHRDELRYYLELPRWYQQQTDQLPESIAYFSPEYGVAAVLPQYSGGLGILAGDHLKAASDMGVPIVAVGLLYSAGYFYQALTRDGWQTESYPVLDPDGLPLSLLREEDGAPSQVHLPFPDGRTLNARIWRADVGRVPLLLLDTNIPGNDGELRRVTDRLYGGGGEHRLNQELLLGMAGVQALRVYSRLTGSAMPEVYHLNEGHAGFSGIQRIYELTQQGFAFDEALEAVRASTVFTTHTPVPAGIDRFDLDLVRRYFSGTAELPGIEVDRMLSLGIENYQGGQAGIFNMAVMGLRLGGRANGVSRLHGEVARDMFNALWPGFDASEVPIGSVTNGVHAPTWTARPMVEAGESVPGLRQSPSAWLDRDKVSDQELWDLRTRLKANFVGEVRRRLRAAWLERGASPAELGWIENVLDPRILTVGFARRVPTYKRLTLMLRDPERLRDLLTDPERPIQIIVAGKSHPDDDQGKALIQQLVRFSDEESVRNRIVFLPNYDIAMASHLYPGCDVWLNNPLRPLEACGTSGMKAALNGALNVSILDGWWDEWFDGENGWAIPTADGVSDPDRRDDLEAAALYDLIENTVAPKYYERTSADLPTGWLHMVRHTLAVLGPKVNAERMVRDYVYDLYLPAARAERRARLDDLAGARDLALWKRGVASQWENVRVQDLETSSSDGELQVGQDLRIKAYVCLGSLDPSDVAVEVIYGRTGLDGQLSSAVIRRLDHSEAYESGHHAFDGSIRLDRSGSIGYTVRIVPSHPLLSSDAEMGLVRLASPSP